MLKSISTQIKKVFCRSDVKTSIAVFALIPVAIAFLISIESGIIQIGDSVFSAMGYASVIIGLLKSLFLIGGIIALISTAVISKEIDSGLDCSYFTRMKNRNIYMFQKYFYAMFCYINFCFCLSHLLWDGVSSSKILNLETRSFYLAIRMRRFC